MKAEYTNLIYAVYHNCYTELFTKPNNVNEFISLLNNITNIDRDFIIHLIALVYKLTNNATLIYSDTFTYNDMYEKICNDIDTIINNTNNVQLLDKDKNKYLTILLLLLSTTGKLTDIDTFIQQYTDFDYDLSNININIDEFIKDYNNQGKTILDILNIISKYQLYKIINVTDLHEELNILILLNNVFNNTALLKVCEYKNKIYDLCIPFSKEDYNVTIETIKSGIYNNFIDISLYIFDNKSNELYENGIITDKNLFKYVGDQIKMSKTKTFNEYVKSVINKSPGEIYDDKTITNINTYNTALVNKITEVFKNISEYNQLGTVITNKSDDTYIKDILILFSKSKDDIKDVSSIDKTPIDEFSKTVIEKLFGTNNIDSIFKKGKKEENILILLSKIYTADGKLNINELNIIFNNYIYVLILIFSKFNDSGLPILYLAIQAIIKLKQQLLTTESENFIMFGDRILFEEDNTKALTIKAAQFGNALKIIVNDAKTKKQSIIDICNDKIVKGDDSNEKNNKLLKFIENPLVELCADNTKNNASTTKTINVFINSNLVNNNSNISNTQNILNNLNL